MSPGLSHPLAYPFTMSQNPPHQPVTEIAFILDRSGSMQPVTEAAISGFNQFLHDQQEAETAGDGLARLTLVQFDDQYEVPINNLPISEVVDLDTTTFVPRGSTALLDAIGRTLDAFGNRIQGLPESQRPDQVIFAIFTDGWENSSVTYSWLDIAGKIRHHREQDGWQFLFLGANQDAIATAAQMNIPARDAATSVYSGEGMLQSQRAFSRKIRAMRRSKTVDYDRLDPSDADLGKSMGQILREEQERSDSES